MAESVDKAACFQEFPEIRTFLGRAAGQVLLAIRLEDVHILVHYVQVASQNDRLAPVRLETLQVRVKVGVPLVNSVVQPLLVLPSVRHIRGDQCEVLELDRDRAALLRVLFAKIELNANWADLREDGRPGVALLCLAAVPVLGVAGNDLPVHSRLVKLFSVDLCLLKA